LIGIPLAEMLAELASPTARSGPNHRAAEVLRAQPKSHPGKLFAIVTRCLRPRRAGEDAMAAASAWQVKASGDLVSVRLGEFDPAREAVDRGSQEGLDFGLAIYTLRTASAGTARNGRTSP
jgi:hypothetical protein